jgi:hypothetical protein
MHWGEWISDSTFEEEGSTGTYSAILRIRPPSYEFVSVKHDSNVAGYLYPKQPAQVGDVVDPLSLEPNYEGGLDLNLDSDYWGVEECYLPLYFRGLVAGGGLEFHICGFARVKIDEVDPPPDYDNAETGDLFMRMTKIPNSMSPGKPWLAPRNASATFDGTQPAVVFPNSSPTWESLLTQLYLLGGDPYYVSESRVYAPAHAR